MQLIKYIFKSNFSINKKVTKLIQNKKITAKNLKLLYLLRQNVIFGASSFIPLKTFYFYLTLSLYIIDAYYYVFRNSLFENLYNL